MHIDSFTAAALADEFRLTIMGGRVQNVLQITPLAYSLELYAQRQRRYLYLSADPQAPYTFLQSLKPRRGAGKPTPLAQLFRKYLRGSLLLTIEQPPTERLFLFHFTGKHGETTLVLELLGTRSNLLFLDAGERILALARPAPAKAQAGRVLLPNHPYWPPPPQQKLAPADLTLARLRLALRQSPADALLHRALVRHMAGLSPLLAREAVFRAYRRAEMPVAGAADLTPLLETLRLLYAHITDHAWAPHVHYTRRGVVDLFAPVALTHLPDAEPVAGMSAAVEAHFAAAQAAPADAYLAARLPVQQAIERARARLERRLQRLAQDAAALQNPETFRRKGEAIFAAIGRIQPGQTELTVDWPGDEPLVISLDPALTPAENAQRYFARYRKAQRAAGIIPQQRQTVLLQLEYLSQLSLDLELAESRPEIEAVHAALREAGLGEKGTPSKGRGKGKKTPAGQPRRFTAPGGYTVWVGRNAVQNHRLTFGRAAPNDVWLHARGVPGAHVVIVAAPGDPPPAVIEWAAGLAAYFSRARHEARVTVSYTRKKYVRPVKGAPPGIVSLRREETITVAPRIPPKPER